MTTDSRPPDRFPRAARAQKPRATTPESPQPIPAGNAGPASQTAARSEPPPPPGRRRTASVPMQPRSSPRRLMVTKAPRRFGQIRMRCRAAGRPVSGSSPTPAQYATTHAFWSSVRAIVPVEPAECRCEVSDDTIVIAGHFAGMRVLEHPPLPRTKQRGRFHHSNGGAAAAGDVASTLMLRVLFEEFQQRIRVVRLRRSPVPGASSVAAVLASK